MEQASYSTLMDQVRQWIWNLKHDLTALMVGKRRVCMGAGLGLFVLICVWVAVQLVTLTRARFPITQVQVQGNLNYVSREDIRGVLSGLAGSSFLGAPLGDVQTNLLAIPWIRDVEIKSVWPDTLHIQLSELPPVAIWEDGHLISRRGDLVSWPAQSTGIGEYALPKLYGQIQQLPQILDRHGQIEPLLGAGQFAIVSMELTRYQHWRLMLRDVLVDALVEVWVSDEDALDKLRDFSAMWPELKAFDGSFPVRLDLRYPQAIAVKWAETANVNGVD